MWCLYPGLGLAEGLDPPVQVQQLLPGGGGRSAVGGAGEEPAELGAAVNDPVIIFLGGHPVRVVRRAAAGHAEGQLVLPQQQGGPLGVSRVHIHLNGGEEVAYPQQILTQ